MRIIHHRLLVIALLALMVFTPRIPFLDAGYGTDQDAWNVANAAKAIRETGRYIVSRFPGYPVHEITCSLFYKGGPVILNGLSAVASAFAAIMLFSILNQICSSCRSFVGSLAFAYTPLMFIMSTQSIDYLWAIALILASWLLAMHNKPLVAGICIGLATGCRITSVLFALPILIERWAGDGYSQLQSKSFTWKYTLSAGFVALLCFIPVFVTYGLQFLTFLEPIEPIPRTNALLIAISGVFGRIGVVGILIGIALSVVELIRQWPRTKSMRMLSLITAIAIPTALFLRLPLEAGYILPAVPFVIIAFALLLPRNVFYVVCLLVISSSFVSITRTGFCRGVIFSDQRQRLAECKMAMDIYMAGQTVDSNSVILCGAMYPRVKALYLQEFDIGKYAYTIPQAEVIRLLDDGKKVYFTFSSDSWEYRQYDHESLGARSLWESTSMNYTSSNHQVQRTSQSRRR